MESEIRRLLQQTLAQHPDATGASHALRALEDAGSQGEIDRVLEGLAHQISDQWPFSWPEGEQILGLIQARREASPRHAPCTKHVGRLGK